MKPPIAKLNEPPPAPVFPKALRLLRTEAKAWIPGIKPQKRANIFSKSRDLREDRGTRQMKTAHNSQSFRRGR